MFGNVLQEETGKMLGMRPMIDMGGKIMGGKNETAK